MVSARRRSSTPASRAQATLPTLSRPSHESSRPFLTPQSGSTSSSSSKSPSPHSLHDPLHLQCEGHEPPPPLLSPTSAATRRPPQRPVDYTMRLYTIDEIPEWQQGNPFLLTAYRCHYTFAMCMKSIFTIHNETANVWTHFLGMLFFLLCSIVLFSSDFLKPVWTHYLIFVPYAAATVICMFFSAAFHLFSGHYCHRVYDRMMQLDYFGITCLVVGSFLPPCYLAFACETYLRYLYLTMILVLGSVGLIGPFFNFWADDRFYWGRLVVYSSTAGSGVFPVVHVFVLLPNSNANPFVLGLALMMLLYMLGMVIYIFKIPERWFPGRFDIWCHSHSIWHVFVLAASVIHFVNCASMYLHWEPMEIHC